MSTLDDCSSQADRWPMMNKPVLIVVVVRVNLADEEQVLLGPDREAVMSHASAAVDQTNRMNQIFVMATVCQVCWTERERKGR